MTTKNVGEKLSESGCSEKVIDGHLSHDIAVICSSFAIIPFPFFYFLCSKSPSTSSPVCNSCSLKEA